MKQTNKLFAILMFLALFFSAMVLCTSCGKKQIEVIQSTTDARGLTSVIYKDGKDTFAIDYLAPSELDSLVCPDCGEINCIYREIDVIYDTTHLDLLDAILNVCNRRGITDSTTIDNIKANYKL